VRGRTPSKDSCLTLRRIKPCHKSVIIIIPGEVRWVVRCCSTARRCATEALAWRQYELSSRCVSRVPRTCSLLLQHRLLSTPSDPELTAGTQLRAYRILYTSASCLTPALCWLMVYTLPLPVWPQHSVDWWFIHFRFLFDPSTLLTDGLVIDTNVDDDDDDISSARTISTSAGSRCPPSCDKISAWALHPTVSLGVTVVCLCFRYAGKNRKLIGDSPLSIVVRPEVSTRQSSVMQATVNVVQRSVTRCRNSSIRTELRLQLQLSVTSSSSSSSSSSPP